MCVCVHYLIRVYDLKSVSWLCIELGEDQGWLKIDHFPCSVFFLLL